MLADLDATLANLLSTEIDESVEIKFDQPNKSWSSGLGNKHTLNLFLFDVRENNMLRQHQWQAVANGNGRPQKKRTAYRFDCHYILTAWTKETKAQHILLSQAAMVLLKYPIIPKFMRVGQLAEQAQEIRAHLGAHDKLTNPAELWGSIENDIRLGISYIVTLAFNPWEAKDEAPPVTTRRITMYPKQNSVAADPEQIQIGGRVTEKTASTPVAGVEIIIRSEDDRLQYLAKTDGNGRYTIKHMPPGIYTLTAWQKTNPITRKQVAKRQIELPGQLPTGVHVKSDGRTFSMRVGNSKPMRGLHMQQGTAGFLGAVQLDNYSITPRTQFLPKPGYYKFTEIRSETNEIHSFQAKVAAEEHNQTSFEISASTKLLTGGNYDLEI